MKTILTILLTIVCTAAFSQDSLQTLSLTNFLSIVKNYHPVAKQAAISVQMADAALLSRRGAFDPVISGGGNDKTFDGTTYYRNNTTQLSIPTWYGIEIQTGIEYLSGSRFNPEATAGKTGFAGISIPLAKNLLMDKRRAALQQAKIMQQASEAERKIMLNDLLLDATDAYWQWVQAYLNFKTYQDLIRVNRQRYNLVKAAFRNGDRPAIDTTEALTQLQQFEYQQNEALLLWQNTGIQLSGYLWQQNNQAYLLPQDIFPQEKIESLLNAVVFPEQELLIDEAKKDHPVLEVYNFKLDALAVQRKLKFQELLPSLDLKYNQLGKGYNIASTATKTMFDNNYKYGISFSMPLRLSSGRGEYKMAKLKISETRLQQNQKQTDIVNLVREYFNRLINYQSQVALLQRTYTGIATAKGRGNKIF
ncbi:MAG: TolC family protein [Chitinophagaceae bacterium]|nr:TolC family protein [Chitinophagaceae bacterium]